MLSKSPSSKAWMRKSVISPERGRVRKTSDRARLLSAFDVDDSTFVDFFERNDGSTRFIQFKSNWERDNEVLEANVIARLEQLEEKFTDQIEHPRHEVKQLVAIDDFEEPFGSYERHLSEDNDYAEAAEDLNILELDLPVCGPHWHRLFIRVGAGLVELDPSMVGYALEGLRNKDDLQLRAAAAEALSTMKYPNDVMLETLKEALAAESNKYVAAIIRGTLFELS